MNVFIQSTKRFNQIKLNWIQSNRIECDEDFSFHYYFCLNKLHLFPPLHHNNNNKAIGGQYCAKHFNSTEYFVIQSIMYSIFQCVLCIVSTLTSKS